MDLLRKLIMVQVIVLFFTTGLYSQGSGNGMRRDSLHLTIYNQGYALVREIRSYNIPNGISTLNISDLPIGIKPLSLRINYDGEILEQTFNESLNSNEKLIAGYIGKDIMYLNKQNQLSEGKLMYVKDKCIAILTKDSSITIIDNFSDGKIIGKSLTSQNFISPSISLKVNRTSNPGNRLQLSYITSGLGWSSNYYLVLDSTENYVDLSSDVILSNTSDFSFQNAEIKLIAGDIKFKLDNKDFIIPPVAERGGRGFPVEYIEPDNFEYKSYELGSITELPALSTKRLIFFSRYNIRIKKYYLYSSNNYYTKHFKVDAIISFRNSKENGMGFLLPNGIVQIYRTNNNHFEFTGSDDILNVSENDSIVLNTGYALNISVNESVLKTVKITNSKKELVYQIVVHNGKNEDVEVIVEKSFSQINDIIKSNIDYKRVDQYKVRFNVPVKSKKETILEFTVSLESMN